MQISIVKFRKTCSTTSRLTLPRRIHFIGICLAIIFISLFSIGAAFNPNAGTAYTPPCEKPGWFPADFGLKDHHIFWYDGFYYLVSILVPPGETDPRLQNQFAYARSTDLCEWEDLSPILTTRTPGAWDETAIWAPYVYLEDDVYYMYFTGVTEDFTQSILLATSTNPSDPQSWQTQGMVFQPDHSRMVWEAGQPSDCRDATVVKVEDIYYLYYAGRDVTGSIIGLATATSPQGPWTDWGSSVPPESTAILESPTIAQFDNAYYLFYNVSRDGGYYRIGASPAGPWQPPQLFRPGWAHEIWQNTVGDWFTSYLTDLTVTISPLSWDSTFSPPRPFIGSAIYRAYLPVIIHP